MVPALAGRDEPMKRATLNPWPSGLDGEVAILKSCTEEGKSRQCADGL